LLGHGKGVGAKPQPLSHVLTKVNERITNSNASFSGGGIKDVEVIRIKGQVEAIAHLRA